MPIYDLFEQKEDESALRPATSLSEKKAQDFESSSKDRFFSSLTARTLFFFLLLADLVWGIWGLCLFSLSLSLNLITLFQVPSLRSFLQRQWTCVKRATVSAIALLIALFSPALGIMVACTYFLMYDPEGIKEIVPSSLQEQFQEFLK